MKVTTRYFEDEVFTSQNENNNTATIDMRKAEVKQNLSPVELVLAALSSCVAVEVVSMIKKRRKTVSDLVIIAEGDRREEHPRALTDIRLRFTLVSPDATNEELYKVTQLGLESYCSVRSSLTAPVSFTTEVIRP
jgi:putative redox protein